MEKTVKGRGDYADDVHPERSVDLSNQSQHAISQYPLKEISNYQGEKNMESMQQNYFNEQLPNSIIFTNQTIFNVNSLQEILSEDKAHQAAAVGYFYGNNHQYKQSNFNQQNGAEDKIQINLQPPPYEESVLNSSIADETKNNNPNNQNYNYLNNNTHKSNNKSRNGNNNNNNSSMNQILIPQSQQPKLKDSSNHKVLSGSPSKFDQENKKQEMQNNSSLDQQSISSCSLIQIAPPIFRLEMKPMKPIHSMTEKKNNQELLKKNQLDHDALEQMDPECMSECQPQLIPKFTYCVNMPQNIPKEQSYEALRRANQQKYLILQQATQQLNQTPVIENFQSFLTTSYHLAKEKPEECAHLLLTLETQFDLILHVSMQKPKEHSKIYKEINNEQKNMMNNQPNNNNNHNNGQQNNQANRNNNQNNDDDNPDEAGDERVV